MRQREGGWGRKVKKKGEEKGRKKESEEIIPSGVGSHITHDIGAICEISDGLPKLHRHVAKRCSFVPWAIVDGTCWW